ncbi:hypothetical protein HGA88_04095 [Candidatus Roizmanbacteria bacterium]|nr:hypothetical protein [Candidatus Roizmanbacteria bacterium]
MTISQPYTVSEAELIELIVARIRTLPENSGISIGGDGEFTKEQMIGHVKKVDKIGKKMIEVELNYLQSLKNLTNEFLSDE